MLRSLLENKAKKAYINSLRWRTGKKSARDCRIILLCMRKRDCIVNYYHFRSKNIIIYILHRKLLINSDSIISLYLTVYIREHKYVISIAFFKLLTRQINNQ